MAYFYFNDKKIKYNPKLLSCDGKPINKEIALENLKLLDSFMTDEKIEYVALYGTCLGAVRDKGFISHDEDCDLGVTFFNYSKVLENLEKLVKKGFKVVRYDERGQFSIWRKGEYIDIIAYKDLDVDLYIACNMYIIPKFFIDEIKHISFYDTFIPVPLKAEEYLLYEYGDTWTIPIKYEERIKKIRSKIKGIIKLIIPKKLKFFIWSKLEKKTRFEYEKKLIEYKNHRNAN